MRSTVLARKTQVVGLKRNPPQSVPALIYHSADEPSYNETASVYRIWSPWQHDLDQDRSVERSYETGDHESLQHRGRRVICSCRCLRHRAYEACSSHPRRPINSPNQRKHVRDRRTF